MRYPSLPGSFQSATCTFAEAGYLRTLRIFDQAEDATDPDKNAAGVQRVQTPLPQLVHLHALSRGDTHQASMEDPSSHDKAGEEEDLDHQTTDDHVLTQSH